MTSLSSDHFRPITRASHPLLLKKLSVDGDFASAEDPGIPALSGPQWVAEKRMLADATNSGALSVEADPHPSEQYLFFFYGSLMDPDVLKTIVESPEDPVLLDAWVEGYEMRMWQGIYPTLLPLQKDLHKAEHAEDSSSNFSSKSGQQSDSQMYRIHGKAWYASSVDQCLALQMYETSAYEPSDCKIHVLRSSHGTEEEDVITGLTFVWAGSPSDGKLTQGTFNLQYWIKEIKPTVWR